MKIIPFAIWDEDVSFQPTVYWPLNQQEEVDWDAKLTHLMLHNHYERP